MHTTPVAYGTAFEAELVAFGYFAVAVVVTATVKVVFPQATGTVAVVPVPVTV